MRKKSHIALASFLAKECENSYINNNRLMFRIGSILPDIKPSFLYKRHEYNTTVEDLEAYTQKMLSNPNLSSRKKALMLGQISHYVADYFTYPHNDFFLGNLKEHCEYEETLKRMLKAYLKTDYASKELPQFKRAYSVEEVFDRLKSKHAIYSKQEAGIECDIEFIVSVNYEVIKSLIIMLQMAEVKNKIFAKATPSY